MNEDFDEYDWYDWDDEDCYWDENGQYVMKDEPSPLDPQKYEIVKRGFVEYVIIKH